MPKSYKTLEIENQCRFGFTPLYVEEKVKNWSVLKDYAYIIHDKDVKADGTPKEPHIHLMMRFNDSVPTTAILSHFDGTVIIDGKEYKTVNENNLQKCYKWVKAIAYLTHANDKDKYQYDDKEVISNYEWQTDRDIGIRVFSDSRLNEIINGIDTELIRKYNYMDYITASEYVKYKKHIEDTFKYVNDRNISKGMVKNMQVMFLTGKSGTGKTTYAKNFCEDHNLSFYVSSGSNDVLDGYGGQDVLILDDLRPSCLGLSDLLKLLDNNTSSTVKSRYYNKSITYCKYIIITTVLPLDEFFNNVFKEEQEPIIQLKRRCKTYMDFSEKYITVYLYDDNGRDYVKAGQLPNTVLEKYKQEELTEEKAIELLNDLFVGMGDIVKQSVKLEPTLADGFKAIPDNIDLPFK